jgi:putative iron-regulated protein
MKAKLLCFTVLSAVILNSCKKPETTDGIIDSELVKKEILHDFTNDIARNMYASLASNASALRTSVENFSANPTSIELFNCQQNWRAAREVWEHSEAFLFGPVSFNNIDPRIDTWPVNFVDLQTELNGTHSFTQEYLNGVQDALKGFHPIEFLLFGLEGDKELEEFTSREMEYLHALAVNLETLILELHYSWKMENENNYGNDVILAGQGTSVYTTRLAVYEEIVNSLSGICDEVANGKIHEPFFNQNPALEESPFSNNSLIDFSNNLKGVRAIYLGQYSSDHTGLNELVKIYDLQLNSRIESLMNAAVQSVENISLPFGQAIIEQPLQIQQCIDAINALEQALSSELLPFIQIHVE